MNWNELRDHCVSEHPTACRDVARLCPAGLNDLRRRFVFFFLLRVDWHCFHHIILLFLDICIFCLLGICSFFSPYILQFFHVFESAYFLYFYSQTTSHAFCLYASYAFDFLFLHIYEIQKQPYEIIT